MKEEGCTEGYLLALKGVLPEDTTHPRRMEQSGLEWIVTDYTLVKSDKSERSDFEAVIGASKRDVKFQKRRAKVRSLQICI